MATKIAMKTSGASVTASTGGGALPVPVGGDSVQSYYHVIYNAGGNVVTIRPVDGSSTNGATRIEPGAVYQTAVWEYGGTAYELYAAADTQCYADLYLVRGEA